MLKLKSDCYKDLMALGGKHFLDSLIISRKKTVNGVKCRICKDDLPKKHFTITEVDGKQVFEERFCSQECAQLALNSIATLLDEYDQYLKDSTAKLKTSPLSEDDERDPLLIRDGETMKEFLQRKQEHLDHLDEICPEIDLESGEERYEDQHI
jgi:hypothetical protein